MTVRGWIALLLATALLPPVVHADEAVERGRYVARAADCMACHTKPGSDAPYAGGYAIASPMGEIWASNITPSRRFGIGDYSRDEFARAVREGIRRDGAHLYPGMPYTAYAKLTDQDINDLYAYFMKGVKPVEQPSHQTALPFPFSIRQSMAVWNLLFLDRTPYTPDPQRSAQWNRGAYLVQGPAHCASCHSPRGLLMQEDSGKALAGGSLGLWYAPNITSDPVAGVGAWSGQDLTRYLRTGRVVGKAQAGGPMAEAVEHSLSHLTETDIAAIVTYLRTVPAVSDPSLERASNAWPLRPQAATGETRIRGTGVAIDDGQALYDGACASCHGTRGEGSPDQYYPALVHNSTVGAPTPQNLIATLLTGIDRTVDGQHVLMPHFSTGSHVQELSDQQVASLATYVRHAFGPGDEVTVADVKLARSGGPTPLLLTLVTFGLPLAGAVVLLALYLLWRRRMAKKRGAR